MIASLWEDLNYEKICFLSAVIGIFFALTISMGATAFAYTWHHTGSHAWDTVYNDHHYFMDGNLTLTEHYDGCHGLGLNNYTTKLTIKVDPATYAQAALSEI